MKFELMSMKSGRHQPFFRFGGTLENLGFPLHEIDAELSDVAGKDPKMIKKKNDIFETSEEEQKPQPRLRAADVDRCA